MTIWLKYGSNTADNINPKIQINNKNQIAKN